MPKLKKKKFNMSLCKKAYFRCQILVLLMDIEAVVYLSLSLRNLNL